MCRIYCKDLPNVREVKAEREEMGKAGRMWLRKGEEGSVWSAPFCLTGLTEGSAWLPFFGCMSVNRMCTLPSSSDFSWKRNIFLEFWILVSFPDFMIFWSGVCSQLEIVQKYRCMGSGFQLY